MTVADVAAAAQSAAKGTGAKPKKGSSLVKMLNGRSEPRAVNEVLNAYSGRMQNLLPDEKAVVAMKEAVFNIIRNDSKLQACSMQSLLGAVMRAVSLGLTPNDPYLQHCHIIPRKNYKSGIVEATFQVGYQGIIVRLHRAGLVNQVVAEVVHDGDHFEYQRGDDPKLIHRPALTLPEGAPMVGAYAVLFGTDGVKTPRFLRASEIRKVREFALKATKGTGPWIDWPEEMAKKTAIKAAAKYLPRETSIDLWRHDDSIQIVKADGRGLVLEAEAIESDSDTEEAEVVEDGQPE